MRWQNRDESQNIEDRRGRSGEGRRGFGGLPIRGKTGLLLVAIILIAGHYGLDLTPLLTGGSSSASVPQPYEPSAHEEELARFSAVALKTTEDAWGGIFRKMGRGYTPPTMVLYSGATETGCGEGQAVMGPFYCPADQNLYLDLSFYQDMKNKLGGGGDFAQGYVIAHEVGHHVQHLLGIDAEVRKAQRGASEVQANRLSVKMELQADCFAGVWGRAVEGEGILEPGDVDKALRTAEAIGDDRLQRQSGGRVAPDSFTHGSSAQRHYWFKRGFDSGDPASCDTFNYGGESGAGFE